MKSKHTALSMALILVISSFAYGQELNWVNKFGLASHDNSYSVTNDSEGNVYIAGEFNGSVDFDPGPGTTVLTSSGIDAYVLKLNADGDLIWARNFGGPQKDVARSVSIDASNNVILAGEFRDTADMDPGAGEHELISAGLIDGFILSLDGDGNFLWAKGFGGTENDNVMDGSVDHAGNVYTTGYFNGTLNADPGASDFTITSNGGSDIFITKHANTGDFLNAGNIGGTGNDRGHALAADSAGNVYTTGYFYSTVDFDPGAGTANITSSGASDAFLLKLDGDFNYEWANKPVSGGGNNRAYDIALYDETTVYLTGAFNNTPDFDPGAGTNLISSNGNADVFIQKLDDTGAALWAKNVGGPNYDQGSGIAVDELGNVYTTGHYSGTADFDPGADTVAIASSGSNDCFVVMLNADAGDYSWAVHLGGGSNELGYSIAVYNSVYVYTTGEFLGLANFDPNGTYNLAPAGGRDIFIHKMYHCFESTASIDTATCMSYVSPSGLYTWTESGTYLDTLVNAGGCDSVITVNLTIHPNSEVEISAASCDEYTSPSGLYTWTETGVYADTLTNILGCDSIITVNLTINNTTLNEINVSACGPYTSPSGLYLWEESGTYNDTLSTIAGCDSILVIDLTVSEPSYASIIDTVCQSYLSPSGLYTWTETGVYNDTITNMAGCDSIITLDLIINTVNIDVTITGITLTATAEEANYQWVDCDNDYAVIEGATDSSYTPASGEGNFAVIVTEGECTDTSSCYAVSNASIADNNLTNAVLYPNPTNGEVTLDLGQSAESLTINIYSLDGQLVDQLQFANSAMVSFELKGNKGIYLVHVTTNELETTHFMMTKQ